MKRLGRVFHVTEREIFKLRFCCRHIPEGGERQVLGQGGDLNRGRGLAGVRGGGNGGDGRVIELLRPVWR